MASEKISQLTDGNPAQSDDLIPIARSEENFSLTAASIAALAPSVVLMDSQGRIPQLVANRKVITGHATLVAGTVTVTLTGDAVVNKPDSYEVVCTCFVPLGTLGILAVTSRGTNQFTINSLTSGGSVNTSDTSVISWVLVCKYDILT